MRNLLLIIILIVIILIIVYVVASNSNKKRTLQDIKYNPETYNKDFLKTINAKCYHITGQDKNARPLIKPDPPGYSPHQIRNAYGLDNIAAQGEGQTVGVILAFHYPYARHDFEHFDQYFGINNPDVLEIHTFGTTQNYDWGLECMLDIQWVHAMAPKAKILLVEARSASFYDLFDALEYSLDRNVNIVSMSWGTTEFYDQLFYNHVFTSKHRNVVFLAASGDTGGKVSWPSSSNNIISVGGTTLHVDEQGNRDQEIGWESGGGGQSIAEYLPKWQKRYGLRGKRHTPDIASVADPKTGASVFFSKDGDIDHEGWFQLGGTSLSCPLMAGMLALVNELRIMSNKSTLNNYKVFNFIYNKDKAEYHENYVDIINGQAGNNEAKVGYDNITGLGVPKNESMYKGFIASLVEY